MRLLELRSTSRAQALPDGPNLKKPPIRNALSAVDLQRPPDDDALFTRCNAVVDSSAQLAEHDGLAFWNGQYCESTRAIERSPEKLGPHHVGAIAKG
jgi:hypothetical protein